MPRKTRKKPAGQRIAKLPATRLFKTVPASGRLSRYLKAAAAAFGIVAAAVCAPEPGSASAKNTPDRPAAVSAASQAVEVDAVSRAQGNEQRTTFKTSHFDFKGRGNNRIEDFSEAKKLLEREVYADHRVTLYCGYPFDRQKNIALPAGFTTKRHQDRAPRVEWEHVVPAENFGRSFYEWREGNDRCKKSNGHYYKGRKCAEKASPQFSRMQADMYNLFPAVGAVNATRSNFNYALLPEAKPSFGVCEMKVQGNKAEPPARSRGEIARAVLYMGEAYNPAYKLSDKYKKLMLEWNAAYPVSAWECTRAARIEKIQGNANRFTVEACRAAGLPYRP